MTCGPAVRRTLEQTPEVELVAMDWDEHWADVRFVAPDFQIEDLQKKLIPAGAWCERWPGG